MAYFSILKMAEVGLSKISVNFYQNTEFFITALRMSIFI
jgi:hypothetical protein